MTYQAFRSLFWSMSNPSVALVILSLAWLKASSTFETLLKRVAELSRSINSLWRCLLLALSHPMPPEPAEPPSSLLVVQVWSQITQVSPSKIKYRQHRLKCQMKPYERRLSKKPSKGSVSQAPSHSMINFVASDSSLNHPLTCWNSVQQTIGSLHFSF